MDEFDLIRRYFAPLISSPGADELRDDVAEIAPGLIVTKDAIVEGVHFPRSIDASAVGYRALAVNLSDIAAMGAEPAWMTLSLSRQSLSHL